MSVEKEVKIYIESTTYEVEASLFDIGDDEPALISSEDIENGLEPDKIVIKTFGKLCVKDGRAEVSYEESEATGMDGAITAISYDTAHGGIVTMLRSGFVSTAFIFERGKRHHCVYNTPYMPFEVCINTFDVKNRLCAMGTLELDYIVEIRGAKAERTKFFMRVTETK